jgi:TolB-like protein/Tfp pilus assembly protein PilF
VQEARRRGVFRVAAVYVIGAWLVMQVADVFFPAWDIPDAALRSLLAAAILGFPVALVFGWLYDLTADGIRRTPPAGADELATPAPLRFGDYATLGALVVAVGLIVYSVAGEIGQSRRGSGVERAAVTAPPNSIAVLPFANISDDPANDYFCDGISEEILHRLGDYRDMLVLARTSSFAFKGTDTEPGRLADMLGVRYLLQGSVRKSAGDLRISASLVDASGYQLWGETFDRKLTGVFEIQSEIAESVVARLADTILESYVVVRAYEPDVDAYQAFLVGREYLHNRSAGYQAAALENFDRAIEIDPRYPEAHAGRAIALMLSSNRLLGSQDPVLDQARESIDLALAMDSDLPIGRAALGLWFDIAEEDYAAAERELRAALEKDPSNANARNWLVRVLDILGRFDEAATEREIALRKDPLNPILNLNQAAYFADAGDFYRAEKLLLRLLDLPSPPGVAMGTLFTTYTRYGRYTEAIQIAKRVALAYSAAERRPRFVGYLAVGYAHLGMWEQMRHWQDYSEAASPDDLFQVLRQTMLQKFEGDYEGMARWYADFMERMGPDPFKLPVVVRRVLGAVNVDIGNLDLGVELFESAFDDMRRLDYDAIEFAHAMAAGYRLAGDPERADEIFGAVATVLEEAQKNGQAGSPRALFLIAQNHAVVGSRSAALHALQKAIDAGWRDYYWVYNDEVRWGAFKGDPRFEAMMARVLEDVQRQRLEVERIDAEDDFRARLEASLAGPGR